MEMRKVLGKGASFIQAVTGDSSKQLQIPHEFTKTFNGNFPKRIFIESSMTKKCWRVEVEKDLDGKTLLRDGWAAFAEAHCLELGNFLLFEYVEQSIFLVKIYGQNGCQKDTIVNITTENHPTSPKVTGIAEEGKGQALQHEPEIIGEDCRQKTTGLSTVKYSNGIFEKQQAVSLPYRRSSSVGQNRKSFSVILAKPYQFKTQTIPARVVAEMKLASKKEVILKVDDANCWIVKLGHKANGIVGFLRGWKDFLGENNIVCGDKLDLKFVSDTIAEVQLPRSRRRSKPADHLDEAKSRSEDDESSPMDSDHGTPQGNYATKDQTVDTSITTKKHTYDEHKISSFSFLWSKTRASSVLYIPRAIAMEQKLKDRESVKLRDAGGKCWPLEVRKWRDGRVDLIKGWIEFWKGADIKNGDTLEFKFVAHRVIEVNISKRVRSDDDTNEEATMGVEAMDVNGAPTLARQHCLLDTPPGFKPLEKHFQSLAREHCLLQAPPGFKPLQKHIP